VYTHQATSVAVLLATYNSAVFVEPQIASLKDNATRFTLHWLDDHSTDSTRAAVRALTARLGIELMEWHHPVRQGVPGAFFHLLECADADVYLFCDHDDIWQPGKIDVTVANLLLDVATPAFCFSEPWVFKDGEPEHLRRYFAVAGVTSAEASRRSRAFVLSPAVGNTVGFTRPLREIFLTHKDIARAHAIMHDWWMYLIALATGTSRMLFNVPTTLYRQHERNVFGIGFDKKRPSFDVIWRRQQRRRRLYARQAGGFARAAAGMTPGVALEQLLTHARLTASIDRRQSVAEIIALLRRRAMPAPWPRAVSLAAICLLSNAKT
jgi:glycosyltransferase involved in cell wall biosynthesis